MGYAVDDTVEVPSGYVPGEVDHHDQWRWESPYETYAHLIAGDGGLAQAARMNRELWIEAVESVPDGSAALVISHGGSIEPGLVHCLPTADHRSWGMPFSHCDGCRLSYSDGQFQDVSFSRAAEIMPRNSSYRGEV